MTWMGADDGVHSQDRDNTVNRIWCLDSNRQCTTPKVCKGYCDAWNNPDNPENQSNTDSESDGEGSAAAGEDADDGENVSGQDSGADEDFYLSEDEEDEDEVDTDDSLDSIFAEIDATDDTATQPEEEEVDRAPPSDGDVPLPEYDSEDEENQTWFEETHKILQPEPLDVYKYVGYPFSKAPWTDKKLQVIVKLASIHLTPEQPTYPGGSWHIEGQLNERIAATALYYYDNDNITDSHLAFRTACNAENMCENFGAAQDDHVPFAAMYGANPGLDEHSTVLEMGKVLTREGRLLVFPNVMQHRVGDFRLVDPARPGHRKIVALFLVDPATPIISTANVPPQQMHWGAAVPGIVESRLPPEVASIVYEHVACPFKLDEAKKLREQLMDERKAIDKDTNKAVNYNTYSFCEH